ncbi:TetR/AcrR family transcriptional regulator [Rheinheimera sediminis]|uniref:TetR/AcrR family transcriptional regulator n=1 Tax=Rheinheimera sp. YQF-1 TaxID=2499626 RepID=UPI000FD79846|nr:TetR/AcrR family transcriptional regulator [Rheinheimera sp. YQF-1]RVT48671.1 TetR/AcrR family transcriptional regulator [Rheinheimera sp. YQF-1]
MSASAVTPAPTVGRPRAFDMEKALQKALEVFWRKGYEGASLPDLCEAMGINKPSLYAAFGNKEQLFLKAIELYENRPCAFFYPALEKESSYEVVKHMLCGAASTTADPDNPPGCVIVQGALACSESAAFVKEALIAKRRAGEVALYTRLEQAKADGDLPDHSDPAALARYIVAVLQGMAVQATSGANCAELKQVADTVLSAWPGKRP